MTDATLAALEALKLPLEHDIDELEHSDDSIEWTIAIDMAEDFRRLQSDVKRLEWYSQQKKSKS